jgi:hypothetical protein
MVTRLDKPAKARKSLPLTERDLDELERLHGPTPERDALFDLAGVAVESVTEAALRAIREKAEEHAYAAAAAERLASGEKQDNRQAERRRRPAWADEDVRS